ncbi:helix-turn-helix domain-containing protein [Streptomyces violaceorubidus]
MTGDAVARTASTSTGKLSKIENDRTMPTVQDVDLVLSALGVSDAVKELFLATARAEVTEATAWRLLRQLGQSAPRDRTRAAALLTRNDRRPPGRGPSSPQSCIRQTPDAPWLPLLPGFPPGPSPAVLSAPLRSRPSG